MLDNITVATLKEAEHLIAGSTLLEVERRELRTHLHSLAARIMELDEENTALQEELDSLQEHD